MVKERLISMYRRLHHAFGPQHWWPADTDLEVIVGAILTQSTSWKNVTYAIARLKEARCLTIKALSKIKEKKLADLVRPAGYYNIKARRLKNFIAFLIKHYRGDLNRMKKKDPSSLRQELLSINGVGPETADSILLYALAKPVFVVDAYTKRALARHHLMREDACYEAVQDLFMRNLKNNVKLFNEFHALFVQLGKEFCLKNKPRCSLCPLR